MKTKFFFSVLASAAALLVASSCSRDAAINEGGPAGEQSGVSLRIQTPKVAYLTRAGIASDAENVVSEILLYAFDEDGNMVGTSNLVEGTDYTATEDAGVTTIEFEDAWLSQVAGKEIVFYAVANQDTGDGTTVTDLEAGTPPVTKTPFEALVSDALTNTDGWVDTSINLELLMTAQSEPIEIVGDATGEMSLKRRIARFDIVNPMAATGDGQVVITNIQAFNGPTQGNIFAAGPNFTPDRANYDLINSGAGQGGAFDSGNPAWSGTVTDGKNGAYVSEVNAKGEDTWRLPSAFYMFPTMLATAPGADNMNLYIEATQNGVEQIYVPSNDVEIKANHRYTLTLHPPTLTFTIDVANFDDGEVTATEPGRETEEITLSATAADGKGGDEITNYEGNWAVYYATSLGDEILTFEVATQFGSDVVFEPTFDGFPVPVWANSSIFTKTTTLTYDAVKGRQTIDKYVATIPAGATDTDNPFTVKFKQTYGDDVKKAYFVSDKDAADILNSCIFDMLNNAAAYNAASLGVDAKFFPLIMENILSLTQNNSTGIVIDDISDLKYFPNLKYFATTAPGFTTDVTSIDLSFLPNLLTA